MASGAGRNKHHVLTGLFVVISGIYVFPFVWMVLGSFKTNEEVLAIPIRWLPSTWSFRNYLSALNYAGYDFPRYFLNSAIVALFSILLCLFLSTTAGYGFAKYRFKGNSLLFTVVMATLMIPLQVIVIPLYVLVSRMGLRDTYLGLILPEGLTAFGVFLMRQFFYSIPDELIEAARIDGASEFKIFWSVALPLSRTAIFALAILHGQWVWNLLLWPLVITTRPEMRTVPLGIALFTGVYFTPYPEQLAISVLSCIPTVLLFVVASRNFMEGIALAGLKS